MVVITAIVGAVGGLFFAFGGYRVFGFVKGIKEYRNTTMAVTVDVASPSWLQLASKRAVKPLQFFRINDEVMGGSSTSKLEYYSPTLFSPKGLTFAGTINTKGGGFCSCRTLGDDEPLGLTSNSTLLIDATGDGQRHKVMLMTDDSWAMSVPTWTHDFVATKKRTTHELRLSDFVASVRGSLVKGATLDASMVTGIGFSLSLYTMDGKPNDMFGDGPFALEVHGVREVLQ